MPKYSIIIPAYNGLPYLESCIKTILSQEYDDYELIVSEDHSTDGTTSYIDTLQDSHIKVLHCPQKMSMAEHWEWALSFATGEWQIFVGQDDGLQNYFFTLADKLTDFCKRKKIQIIMSKRAYYFYDGCQPYYGDTNISYHAKNRSYILNTKKEMFNKLYKEKISYMDFPSMYTTSMFHKSFINYLKQKQGGKIFTTHPQDANLAALAAIFSKRYLYSEIPLGWVGSSVKSAGLAITIHNNKNELSNDYLKKTKESKLKCNEKIGNFLLDSHPLYFWGALLTVSEIHNKKLYIKLNSNKIKQKIFFEVKNKIANSEKRNELEQYYKELLIINNMTDLDINQNEELLIMRCIRKVIRIFIKIWNKLFINENKYIEYSYYNYFSDGIKTMEDVSIFIKESLTNKGLI